MIPIAIAAFLLGAILGGLAGFLLARRGSGGARELAREIATETSALRATENEALLALMRETVGNAAGDALTRNTDQFLKLANETLRKQSAEGSKELEGKKQLIDQTLTQMKSDLNKVENLVKVLEKDREQKFGELATHLKTAISETTRLQQTAGKLSEALASSRARGQWGERMAEDVLRLAGFIEGVNYIKQESGASGTRPDYTFPLPHGLKVNMDVKFPLDNYLQYVNAEEEQDRERYRQKFVADVRGRVREVTTRDYVDPEEGTVNYVLVFIPNEQVYAFLNESDPGLMDEALGRRVVLCSPLTLYAFLAVIRMAYDSVNMQTTASEILKVLGGFEKQWGLFVDALDKLGRRVEGLQKDYDELRGLRVRQLEKTLHRVDELRTGRGDLEITDGSEAPEDGMSPEDL